MRWLMTDERMGAGLWAALRRLPPGSGVIFRHYGTPAAERRRLLRRVERIAAARRLFVTTAGAGASAKGGVHGAAPHPGPRSRPAHNRREAVLAARQGATWLFVSPVYPTRSHPGARALSPMRAARIATGLGVRAIALGGMTEQRWRRIARWGFDGWAGIDAWL